MAPMVGPMVDRYGGRWLMAGGALVAGGGFILLSQVRGLGVLISHAFGAAGAPFFGYLHDATGSYDSSFVGFVVALALSALLSLLARAPRKRRQKAG